MEQQQIPECIAGPAGHQFAFELDARGVQIYRATWGDNGVLSWVHAGPVAELLDKKGKVIGTHFEGPSWKHEDGSEIRAKTISSEESPDPNAVPWLLMQVVDKKGTGLLSRVSHIQRVATSGGRAPKIAPASEGELVRVPYTAVYRFLTPITS